MLHKQKRRLELHQQLLNLHPGNHINIIHGFVPDVQVRRFADGFCQQHLFPHAAGEALHAGGKEVGGALPVLQLVRHRLVADDAVEIRKASNITLVGSSPDNIRHFMELRGIGIINARQLFGMGAVKVSEKIDMVVELELWNPEKVYDRMGVDNHYVSILGVKVPSLTIPVKPGRNLAVILEVAAMNNRQKKMGYNAAQELLDNLGLDMESSDTVKSMG